MDSTVIGKGAVAAPIAKPQKLVATVELRFRKVYFGKPILQQLWRGGTGVWEWRDVPEVAE